MEVPLQFEMEDESNDAFFLERPRIRFSNATSELYENMKSLKSCFSFLRALFSKIWNIYISVNTNSVTAVILLLLVIGVNIALFFVAVLTHPVQVDYSLRAFEVQDHPVSRQFDSLVAAKNDMTKSAKEDRAKQRHGRRKRSQNDNPEIVIHSQYRQKWRLDLVYLAKDGDIFTEDKLNYIHKIEKNLMNDPQFQDFCWKNKDVLKDPVLSRNLKGCMPPNSLIDYFYRTDYFDGQGKSLSNIKETIDYLLTKMSTFWYVDAKFGAEYRKSKFLRSQLNFGIPLKGYENETLHTVEEQHQIFWDFLVKYVEQLGSASSDQVTVLYGSPEIYDYEIKSTFIHDVLLAAISFGLIIFLLFILTSFSLWLTIFGVCTIVFSVPFSYFVYRVLLRINTIGILTGTTVFVIIGIGVDDVFVFINVFRQATHFKDIKERMKHLIVTAGKATFFTSFTTAAAFGANAFTKVPAVHDFGLFTCILVMSCWLMVVLLMPPTLFLWQRWLIKCEMCLCLNKCCHRAVKDFQMDSLMTSDELELNRGETQMYSFNTETRNSQEDEDLEVQAIADSQKQQSECCTITNLLTRFMDYFIARPVIKGRYVVVVVYFVITALSIVGITRLKTASGRPELFPSNTNLQKLLNLQYNFSSGYVDCSSCSGALVPVHPKPHGHSWSSAQRLKRELHEAGFWGHPTTWNGLGTVNGTVTSHYYDLGTSEASSAAMNAEGTSATTIAAKARPTEHPSSNTTSGLTTLAKEDTELATIKQRTIWPTISPLKKQASKKLFESTTTAVATTSTIASREHKEKHLVPKTTATTTSTVVSRDHTDKQFVSKTMAAVTTMAITENATTESIESITTARKSASSSVNQTNTVPKNITSNLVTTAAKSHVVATTTRKALTKNLLVETTAASEAKTEPDKGEPETTKATAMVPSKTVIRTTEGTVIPTTQPLCPKPCTPVKRPIVDKTAIVFLVFGIKGVKISQTRGQHFFGTDRGTPIYDPKFTMIGKQLSVVATGSLVKALCKICLAFQNNSDIVSPGGADCFPKEMYRQLRIYRYDECQALIEPKYANGRISLSTIGVIHNEIKWMAMTFESQTYKGKSAFLVHDDYKKWENFTKTVLSDPEIPEMLKSGFQTSDEWVNMFSEMIAVSGAIYGITMSLVMCLAAVVIFTGNFKLSFIVFATIGGALSLVIAVFYIAGWTLGAVEAISLSILVGTSVDYTVHLTEGYIMAKKFTDFDDMSNKEVRAERTRLALSHIGVSIFSSAITTLIAAIPLCLTTIQLFAKFGQILALNTAMSIVYTLTICVSLLSIMGPTRFKGGMKSHCFALFAVAFVIGLVFLLLYLVDLYTSVSIPGPSGGRLFH